MSNKILKLTTREIAKPLRHLVNSCLEKGIFPIRMKIAGVIPLFKKGDHMCRDNYRPVSLLPILSKILERTMFVRLRAFFDKNCIINDDTTSITVRPGLQETISKSNQTVEMITHWLEVDRSVLNYEKTSAILFRNNKRKTIELTNLRELHVRTVESAKLLGITVDSCLGWIDHISNISNKLSSATFALRQIKPLITEDDVCMVYFSNINAVMSYGIEIWGHSTEASKIFKLQKRAIRIIGNKRTRDSCKPLFEKYNILTFYSLYVYKILLLARDHKDKFNKNEDKLTKSSYIYTSYAAYIHEDQYVTIGFP
ncbi:uncharacterized protein LOC126212772 [Schistocerca nitens]|uniref:uncharacterized protein LOC126212772 n=1 Tax=Schistocerca nitens TaxID=7011 RepID=UPI002119108D|nr:uncharacterized protein LOC126212772 [Schistocerca nitens]